VSPDAAAYDDTEAGMRWWNALTIDRRAEWLRRANSARPVDAWRLYRAETLGLCALLGAGHRLTTHERRVGRSPRCIRYATAGNVIAVDWRIVRSVRPNPHPTDL
jgi:hypothetical protein